MNDKQKACELLGWKISLTQYKDWLVEASDTEAFRICCDDAFLRLVEAELERRGLLDEYAHQVSLMAAESIKGLPVPGKFFREATTLAITAPASVKIAAAVRVLEGLKR